MATIMAMIAPMNTVPQNNGIEPNAPDEPAWSARSAVCGLQLGAEQEFGRADQLEEAQAFEQQRQDDAERRQDGDQRGGEQQAHQPSLDAGAGAEIGADPAQRKKRADASARRMAMPPPIAA